MNGADDPPRDLADVYSSVLAALGVGGPNPLGVPDARTVCLLLIDGLGWELLHEHATDAPVLAELAAGTTPLRVGFPSSTPVSIATLGTGLGCGGHGLTGIAMAPDADSTELLHTLRWTESGPAPRTDRRDRHRPERLAPQPTLPQRVVTAGLAATVVAPGYQRGSGLTRAALRGARFVTAHGFGDLASGLLDALGGDPGFCYGYHGDLDLIGHVHGPGSTPWRLQLAQVDRLVEAVLDRLPPGAVLAVVADHGMVTLTDLVDAEAEPTLMAGVRLIGGDPRARYVYTEPGAQPDVLAAWRAMLGERATVLPRDEAVTEGWFGPVNPEVLDRIGDVVVAAHGGLGILRGASEPEEATLLGAHGSLSDAETLVPFLAR